VKAFRLGLIRVMTLGEEEVRWLERQLERLFPGLFVTTVCLPDQPEGVHDEFTFETAEPKVMQAALSLEEHDVNAILINCAADPGLAMTRKVVKVPVFGAGSTSAFVARAMGLPVGVLGLSEDPPRAVRDVLGPLLKAAGAPRNVKTALDLPRPESRGDIIQVGLALKDLGAQTLLMTCTGMSTMAVSDELRTLLGMPVIDPLMASLTLISHLGLGRPSLGNTGNNEVVNERMSKRSC